MKRAARAIPRRARALQLAAPGAWRVEIVLRNLGEPGIRRGDDFDWAIDVRDEPGEQRFESPPPTPEFLESLARRSR